MAATRATTPMISVEENLHDPKYELCEYLDGVIKEKYPIVQGVPGVSNVHSALVGLIIRWFGDHKQWRVKAGPEATTVINASRYRLPDVSVLRFGPMDPIQVKPPLIAIEVLSASNSMSEMLKKLKDYELLGIPNVWIIDPDTRTGQSCRGIALTETTRFTVADTPIYLDLPMLFAQFDEENEPVSE